MISDEACDSVREGSAHVRPPTHVLIVPPRYFIFWILCRILVVTAPIPARNSAQVLATQDRAGTDCAERKQNDIIRAFMVHDTSQNTAQPLGRFFLETQ